MATSIDDEDEPSGGEAGSDAEASWAQRLADARIVAKLDECGFDGPEWRALSGALMAYGYSVLVVWGCTGMLPHLAAERGGVSGHRVPAGLRLDRDQAHALATEVVLTAIERFRTHSLPHWTLDGGATLNSWFITRCLMELADVHRAWQGREMRSLPLEAFAVDDGRHCPRPDEQAEARVLLDRLIALDPGLCLAAALQEAGYTLAEIADELGTTPAAIRSRIHRGRRNIRTITATPEEDEA